MTGLRSRGRRPGRSGVLKGQGHCCGWRGLRLRLMERAGGAERAGGRMENLLEDVKFHVCVPVPCVTLGMSPDLSEPLLPHLKDRDKNTSWTAVRIQ